MKKRLETFLSLSIKDRKDLIGFLTSCNNITFDNRSKVSKEVYDLKKIENEKEIEILKSLLYKKKEKF